MRDSPLQGLNHPHLLIDLLSKKRGNELSVKEPGYSKREWDGMETEDANGTITLKERRDTS